MKRLIIAMLLVSAVLGTTIIPAMADTTPPPAGLTGPEPPNPGQQGSTGDGNTGNPNPPGILNPGGQEPNPQ